VRVPKGLTVQFATVNGAVRLQDLTGQVTASTTNGGVVGRGLSGPVKARTTNGGLQIEMTSLGGEVSANIVAWLEEDVVEWIRSKTRGLVA